MIITLSTLGKVSIALSSFCKLVLYFLFSMEKDRKTFSNEDMKKNSYYTAYNHLMTEKMK